MLRINDFVFYIPMKGNATDYSLNGYSTTVTGAALTTDKNSVSNMAYDFDGVNDEITMGTAAYDALIDAFNAGVVSVYANIINNKTASQNDIILGVYDGADFNKAVQISEYTTTPNYTVVYLGGGLSDANNIYTSVAPTLSTWKRMIYETTYATTKYTGRVLKDGTALGLTRSETNQVITKSTNANREIAIGWRQDSPTNRSFKGKMNNVFAIKKVLSDLEQKYISKFDNMKRIA